MSPPRRQAIGMYETSESSGQLVDSLYSAALSGSELELQINIPGKDSYVNTFSVYDLRIAKTLKSSTTFECMVRAEPADRGGRIILSHAHPEESVTIFVPGELEID